MAPQKRLVIWREDAVAIFNRKGKPKTYTLTLASAHRLMRVCQQLRAFGDCYNNACFEEP